MFVSEIIVVKNGKVVKEKLIFYNVKFYSCVKIVIFWVILLWLNVGYCCVCFS